MKKVTNLIALLLLMVCLGGCGSFGQGLLMGVAQGLDAMSTGYAGGGYASAPSYVPSAPSYGSSYIAPPALPTQADVDAVMNSTAPTWNVTPDYSGAYAGAVADFSSDYDSSSGSGSSGGGSGSTTGKYDSNHGTKDCHLCHGSGVCQTCNGRGVVTNYGKTDECPNCWLQYGKRTGKCSGCQGKGKKYGNLNF